MVILLLTLRRRPGNRRCSISRNCPEERSSLCFGMIWQRLSAEQKCRLRIYNRISYIPKCRFPFF